LKRRARATIADYPQQRQAIAEAERQLREITERYEREIVAPQRAIASARRTMLDLR